MYVLDNQIASAAILQHSFSAAGNVTPRRKCVICQCLHYSTGGHLSGLVESAKKFFWIFPTYVPITSAGLADQWRFYANAQKLL